MNVKATTNEGMGFVGRGEGIAALRGRADRRARTMSDVRIHDSLSGAVRELEPREPGKVGIYACGPTVYGRIHVGNARPYVVFALLKRFLEHEGYEVTLVENITDINDKIYDAAREAGVPSRAARARDDGRATGPTPTGSGSGRPDREPLASETIGEIIDLIEALIERGHAYPADGDVYFSVRSFADYGKLSNRRLDELRRPTGRARRASGAASATRSTSRCGRRRSRARTRPGTRPGGAGGPGWHIECSAMAEAILGLDFDIHGGGSDLIFPHHENEIAQTEAGRGRPLARLWMHNGMVRFGEEKMAKSVGNITLLADALDRYGRDALIMYLLRRPLPPAARVLRRALEEARARGRADRQLRRLVQRPATPAGGEPGPGGRRSREEFFAALRDDFNTPEALAALFELDQRGQPRGSTPAEPVGRRRAAARCSSVIGLEHLLEARASRSTRRRCGSRPSARRRGAPATSTARTALRDELRARGYEVRDTPEGPGAGAAAAILTAATRCGGVCAATRRSVREAERRPPARHCAHLERRTRSTPRGARAALRLAGPSGRRGRGRALSLCRRGRRCWQPDDALVVALDQVQDPQNLGAICRSAEGAGATGVVIPERGAAQVTPAVCRASAGAVEHLPVARRAQPRRLPGGGQARPGAWVYGAEAGRATPLHRTSDYAGRVVLVLGLGGPGPAAAGAGRLRRARRRCPCAGRLESLNVGAAAAVLLYEVVSAADEPA